MSEAPDTLKAMNHLAILLFVLPLIKMSRRRARAG